MCVFTGWKIKQFDCAAAAFVVATALWLEAFFFSFNFSVLIFVVVVCIIFLQVATVLIACFLCTVVHAVNTNCNANKQLNACLRDDRQIHNNQTYLFCCCFFFFFCRMRNETRSCARHIQWPNGTTANARTYTILHFDDIKTAAASLSQTIFADVHRAMASLVGENVVYLQLQIGMTFC